MGTATLTWSPAETDITEIATYQIFRNEDAGEYALLIECAVLRDMFGGIIGVQHCTTTASRDDDTGQVVDKFIEDAPVTYVDDTVQQGHAYCYYVLATPMGNNLYTGSGPPSAPSNVLCVTVLATATIPVLAGSIISPTEIDLSWTAATVVGSTIATYVLYRQTDGGGYSIRATIASPVLIFADTTVSAGHTYDYFVVAHPVLGNDSANSNVVTETIVGGSLWAKVDGGIFAPTFSVATAVAVVDALHAVVVSDNGRVAYTLDAGATWVLVNVAAVSFFAVASDGTHVVAQSDAEAIGKLWYSADQGATWTNVTPGGFSANDGVNYFPGIGKFVAFDTHANPSKVATSSTGALGTWTVTALSNQFVLSFGTGLIEANGALIAGGIGSIITAEIRRSTDGNTWSIRLDYVPGGLNPAFGPSAYNGTVWNILGQDAVGGGHFVNYTSADNGLSWTQRVNGPQTGPPFNALCVAVGTRFVTGVGNNGSHSTVGLSIDNGLSWSEVALPTLTLLNWLSVFNGVCYAFGDGVVSSPDGSAWTQELDLTALSSSLTFAHSVAGLTLAVGHDGDFNGAIYKRTPGA